MAEIQLKHVYKKYEEIDNAADDRRIGGNIRRGASDRWKNDESGTVMRQRYCNGVSELCTVPAYDRI